MTRSGSAGANVEAGYDVAVVGCGMAGLSAGIAAAEAGAEVVVLEKAPEERRGGQTQYTESFRIPTADIDLGLEFDVPDYTPSDYYHDIMQVTGGKADPELVETLTGGAAGTFEWLTGRLREQGFEWRTEPLRSAYSAGRVWHDGERLVDALVGAALDAGVEVVYDAEARRLRQGGTNRIRGVEAFVAGERVEYRTDAVVIACGGFESNAERRTRYLGQGFEEVTVRGVRYNTGEAIGMALDAGAKPAGQWSGAHMTVIDAGTPPVEGGQTLVSGYQFGVVLNHEGERFVDEGEDFRAKTYAKFGREIFEQPYHEAFVIQDASTDEFVVHTGPTDPVRADSIEELVARLDIENGERAAETVREYNAACDPDAEPVPTELDGNRTEGLDPEKSNWAVPLEEAPLVGYPVTGGLTFTFGGLAQTPDAEVLDTSHEPIPGLYAAGNATGGLFYDNYPGSTGLVNAAVFGRIAGEGAGAPGSPDHR